MPFFEDNTYQRGLHIAIINPCSGKLHKCARFDTSKSSVEMELFIQKDVP